MGLVFVLNCGSSSIKFQIIDPLSQKVSLQGIAENLNTPDARLQWNKSSKPLNQKDYQSAFSEIVTLFNHHDITAIGHRVVHGGEFFQSSQIITDQTLSNIKACNHLAPLHNPINALGIETMRNLFPKIPQVAVFDTSFHQSMPEVAYLYPLPYSYYEQFQVRRYGFHGTSHQYVAIQAAKQLGIPLSHTSFISCHLGNGCSITAIKGGESIDTSMGMTPLEGVMMGQRCGDIDPSIVEFLTTHLDITPSKVVDILNTKSGLLGVSQLSADMRILLNKNTPQTLKAIHLFCYRIAKYIASYIVPLQKVDRVIFTGGIGENSSEIRGQIMDYLKPLNLRSIVIKTNEELMIAQETIHSIKRSS